ncbi:CLUMA_CG009537, isoform A [Clunio marinus]|uniref:CLUMA_CG009537, isoform A n=1 Tax=Clunio marinus TaxID=568069 RepID=A0A1J1I748_9DIPT|nr:CLUMA_CG009537, isoform A [Clunio marinus]
MTENATQKSYLDDSLENVGLLGNAYAVIIIFSFLQVTLRTMTLRRSRASFRKESPQSFFVTFMCLLLCLLIFGKKRLKIKDTTRTR